VAVAGDDGFGLGDGDGAGGPADVEDLVGALGEDAGDAGVAGDAAGGVAADGGAR